MMNNIQLFGFYSMLSKISFFKYNYFAKVILIVCATSLLPLVTVLAYTLLIDQSTANFFIPLVLAVITIMLNIVFLYLLLKPILFTIKQLDGYINNEATPLHLPSEYEDEVGLLIRHVQYITQKLDFLTRSQSGDPNLDPLTKTLNRQAGEERLRQDVARASRDSSRLLVALLDIDNFSQINEDFGRHMGDLSLTHVAEVTLNNIRKGDWIARWGGDRFLMVLWNFNNGEPRVVLERIQNQSTHTPMNGLLKLSLSIGACDYQNEVDVDLLLGKLNECIYQAKQTGGGIEICRK